MKGISVINLTSANCTNNQSRAGSFVGVIMNDANLTMINLTTNVTLYSKYASGMIGQSVANNTIYIDNVSANQS